MSFRENKMYYIFNTNLKGKDIYIKNEKLSFEMELKNRQVVVQFQPQQIHIEQDNLRNYKYLYL